MLPVAAPRARKSSSAAEWARPSRLWRIISRAVTPIEYGGAPEAGSPRVAAGTGYVCRGRGARHRRAGPPGAASSELAVQWVRSRDAAGRVLGRVRRRRRPGECGRPGGHRGADCSGRLPGLAQGGERRGRSSQPAGAHPRVGRHRPGREHQPGRTGHRLHHRAVETADRARAPPDRTAGVPGDPVGVASGQPAERRGAGGGGAAGWGGAGGSGAVPPAGEADTAYLTRAEFTPGAGAKLMLNWTRSPGVPRFVQVVVVPEQPGVVPAAFPLTLPMSRVMMKPMNSPLISYCPLESLSVGLRLCGPTWTARRYTEPPPAEASNMVPQIWKRGALEVLASKPWLVQAVPAVLVGAM